MNKDVTITVTIDQIKQALQKLIKSEHSKLIANVIVDNLSVTDRGLSQLYNAFTGVQDICPYKIGQEVLVDVHALSSWRFDKKAMKDANIIINDKIKCSITDIDMLRNTCIHVKYTYLTIKQNIDDIHEDTKEEDDNWVKLDYAHPVDNLIIDNLPF